MQSSLPRDRPQTDFTVTEVTEKSWSGFMIDYTLCYIRQYRSTCQYEFLRCQKYQVRKKRSYEREKKSLDNQGQQ